MHGHLFVRLLMVTWLNIWLISSEFLENTRFCFSFPMKPDHYINFESQTVLHYTMCDEKCYTNIVMPFFFKKEIVSNLSL